MATDWLPELADDDLATLMEALEAWEVKDQASEMFGDVMEAVVTTPGTRESQAFVESRQREKQKRDAAKSARKERSVLLRAKLLMLRERRRTERGLHASLVRENAGVTDPVDA